jgi:hypothetical protein
LGKHESDNECKGQFDDGGREVVAVVAKRDKLSGKQAVSQVDSQQNTE